MPESSIPTEQASVAKSSRFDSLVSLLASSPTWLGPVLAVMIFVSFHYVAPSIVPGRSSGVDISKLLVPVLQVLGVGLGLGVLAAWAVAEWVKLKQRRLLDRQTGPVCEGTGAPNHRCVTALPSVR